jgi:hypothetical protein
MPGFKEHLADKVLYGEGIMRAFMVVEVALKRET